MERQQYLKELILTKLKEDYAVALESGLEYCYDTYKSLIQRAENIIIIQPTKRNAKELTEIYINELNQFMGKKMSGTYRNANNRISLFAMTIDDFIEFVC